MTVAELANKLLKLELNPDMEIFIQDPDFNRYMINVEDIDVMKPYGSEDSVLVIVPKSYKTTEEN